MSNYRRLYIAGGVYFFTLITHNRRPILCQKNALSRLKDAFRHVMLKHPFRMHALVILPDHLHCVWQLPHNDHDFSKRWNLIKRYFSIGMKSDINHRREKTIWQKRFWEHWVRDQKDLERCFDYIHYNPVKHGYVQKPYDWEQSSFKDKVKKGYYDQEWGSSGESPQIQLLNFEYSPFGGHETAKSAVSLPPLHYVRSKYE